MAKACKLCQYGRLLFSSVLLGCLVWYIMLHMAVGLSLPWLVWVALIANVILVIWTFWGVTRMNKEPKNL